MAVAVTAAAVAVAAVVAAAAPVAVASAEGVSQTLKEAVRPIVRAHGRVGRAKGAGDGG